MRSQLVKILPRFILHNYRRYFNPIYNERARLNKELSRIRNIPRYIFGTTNIFKNLTSFIDSASFIFMFDEIFSKQIYKFPTANEMPYIIDCGANIGLSVIYFKTLYPNAEIIAFEPDSEVFKILKLNTESFSFSNVQLIPKACWNLETEIEFQREGADGGRIGKLGEVEVGYKISTIRLCTFLTKQVEFLKIDIEGAETNVLEDCADLLVNVKNLFVEYHSFNDENQTLSVILNILTNAGFRYQIQHVGVFSNHPYLGINTHLGMDLQLNIFAYRT